MPNPPSNLHQVAVTNSTITVEWNPPIASGTRGYDAYTIYIRNQEEYSAEVHLEDNARTTTFTDLQPGTQYTIRLVSSIGGTLSEQRVINVLTSKLGYSYIMSPGALVIHFCSLASCCR